MSSIIYNAFMSLQIEARPHV